jgi:para-nitrobenzyl esterase
MTSDSYVVRVTGGQVSGIVRADGVTSFLGIPYAFPPVGPGLLRAPQPPVPWEGVRPATTFGPIPPQPVPSVPGMPVWTADAGDDILTVNVWLPVQRETGLPVLVWIYGGGYSSGCAEMYDPTALVEAGLAVVSFNYRVGVAGFAHVPGAPDNRGLLDQVAALRWVRDNITAFGGDPDNVTIAGESAGAGSVAALLAMPAAAGLFRRAIAHSVPSEYFSLEAADTIGRQIAEAAGVAHDVDAIASLDATRLVAAGEEVLARYQGDSGAGVRRHLPTVFGPVVDGSSLPANPLAAVAAGAATGVDLLLCHTVDEFRLFSMTGAAPEIATDTELAQVAAEVGLSAEALDRYRATAPGATVPDLYGMIMTDFCFGEYTTRLAEAAGRAGGHSFLARFGWRSPVFDGALRACHGADLPFVFGNLLPDGPVSAMLIGDDATASDWALSERMVDAWVTFAAKGSPGWPTVTAASVPVRLWDLTDSLDTDPGPDVGRRAVWSEVDFQSAAPGVSLRPA